jgi:hypothetical protein
LELLTRLLLAAVVLDKHTQIEQAPQEVQIPYFLRLPQQEAVKVVRRVLTGATAVVLVQQAVLVAGVVFWVEPQMVEQEHPAKDTQVEQTQEQT